ncbi:MAG: RNase adapter RapZ [Saccharofermentans sp.]|nr:RNase adapter RapZ [Saccharofermentans sp.]
MELILLTGMSGAGKTQAVNFLEDSGFFCMDNCPPYVIPDVINGFIKGTGSENFGISKLAFVVDCRSQELLEGFTDAIKDIERMGCVYKIVFLEASDTVLIGRYQQTRRKHPLANSLSLTDAIKEERSRLREIRAMADNIIDTTMLTTTSLREKLKALIVEDDTTGLSLFIESFGFKFGLPADCDYVFDVRFLPNPYYIPELKNLTGEDSEIAEYLTGFEETDEFLDKACDMLGFTIPYFMREGKGRVHVGVGCTGGRHRSVYCATRLYSRLKDQGFNVILNHRDIGKEEKRYS